MAEIISLAKARKARARADKELLASGNRAKFGRTKAEKQLDKAKDVLATRRIDGHRRNPDDSEG